MRYEHARAHEGLRHGSEARRVHRRSASTDSASTYKTGRFARHGLSRAMTNELDHIFASLPTDPARKRKRGAPGAATHGDDRAPPHKRAGTASAPASEERGDAADAARRPKAPPSAASASSDTPTDGSKNARAAESKADAPRRRTPVVVHDTSAPARASAPVQPRARPSDDDDAAFADSRGRDRMYGLLTQANARRRGSASLPKTSCGSTRVAVRRRSLTQARRSAHSTATAVGGRA